MTSPTEGSNIIHYSDKHNTTVSGIIGQQEECVHNTASKDNNTPHDDLSTALDEQHSVGGICMVAQTSKCLQFHPARIQKISGNTVSVMYLSTNEEDIIPVGSQVRSIEQVELVIER